jgi:RimJ/RimL family protein N-acetyltransferase
MKGSKRTVHFVGERIFLSPVEVEDDRFFREWINDPENWATLARLGPLNACREREWIEAHGKSPNDYTFGIAVKQDDRLIGSAGLHGISWVDRSAAFGIIIGDTSSQGKDYGVEATKLVIQYGLKC